MSIIYYKYSILLLPIALITGPFIPDAIITLSSLFFLFEYFFLKKKIYEKLFFSNFFKLFFLFYIILILSSLFSEHILFSLQTSIAYLRFGIFALIVQFVTNNDEKFLKILFIVLILAIFFLCMDGIFQLINGHNIFGLKHASPNRITSFFGNDIKLGSYLVRMLPLSIFLYFYNLKNINKNFKKLFLINIFLSFVVILISGERAALISFFIIFFIMILILEKKYRKKILIFFLLWIVFFATLIQNNEYYYNRIIKKPLVEINNTIENNNIVVNKKYTEMYNTSIKMFAKNYILGIGVKNFRKDCLKEIYSKDSLNGCSTHPHHTYLQILAEIGIFGFVILILIFLKVLKNLFSIIVCRKNINKNNCFILLNISFLITLNPLLPSGNFFNNWISVIYFLPIGIYLALKKNY